MAKNKFSKTLTEAQLARRADILRRKQDEKRANIERTQRRAAKHAAFGLAIKF